MRPIKAFDTEVYRDFYLLKFKDAATGEVHTFEMYPEQVYDELGMLDTPTPAKVLDIKGVRRLIASCTLLSFNGINYDMPLLSLALNGADCATIKKNSDAIIKNNIKYWQLGIDIVECDHIDIIEVAPGIASLKAYCGRLHSRRIQDLPIEPDAEIMPSDRAQLDAYCENDLDTLLDLFNKLRPQIELRERMGQMYGLDLRSKSDAQIAEAVIRHEVEKRGGFKLKKQDPFRFAGDTFKYKPPEFVRMREDIAAAIAGSVFTIESNGTVRTPEALGKLKITIGASTYKMGIGGLHSTEKRAVHRSDDDHIVVDRDVASYYPSIILNCGLRPIHMGVYFPQVYRELVERRLKAKHDGDKVTADALKITINGSFGKFGSPYSILYSPTLLIQTTVTGQLSLLMLIEALEAKGISVVSANTDGIVIKCRRDRAWELETTIWEWEAATGFVTEETEYSAIYSRDVNNYVAIKPGGGFKLKGVYAPAGLQKNPTSEICIGAVVRHLVDGAPIEQSVRECKDIRKFVSIRAVNGGAVKGDQCLGKTVRWYYARGVEGHISYKLNGYKVAGTDGAKPLMVLPDELPDDIDHDAYITEAIEMLKAIGGAT